jgi:hypothetical protein
MTEQPPDAAYEELGERIAADLRRVVHVQRPTRTAIVTQPGFWERCRLVTPDWQNGIDRIYVDGFARTCYWNCLKVYDNALEQNLLISCGYALWQGEWYGHAWCMLGPRIIETTMPFRAYYGATLNSNEISILRQQHQKHDLLTNTKLKVVTFINGYRGVVDYDPAIHAATIGRERDPQTREVKPGLGRNTIPASN